MKRKLRHLLDVKRTLLSASVFFFLLGAAQTTIIPFLIIFYRRLGFTPLHVGTLFCIKSLVAAFAVPLWSLFSRTYSRVRFSTSVGIFFLILTYLLVTLVPRVDHLQCRLGLGNREFCQNFFSNDSLTSDSVDASGHELNNNSGLLFNAIPLGITEKSKLAYVSRSRPDSVFEATSIGTAVPSIVVSTAESYASTTQSKKLLHRVEKRPNFTSNLAVTGTTIATAATTTTTTTTNSPTEKSTTTLDYFGNILNPDVDVAESGLTDEKAGVSDEHTHHKLMDKTGIESNFDVEEKATNVEDEDGGVAQEGEEKDSFAMSSSSSLEKNLTAAILDLIKNTEDEEKKSLWTKFLSEPLTQKSEEKAWELIHLEKSEMKKKTKLVSNKEKEKDEADEEDEDGLQWDWWKATGRKEKRKHHHNNRHMSTHTLRSKKRGRRSVNGSIIFMNETLKFTTVSNEKSSSDLLTIEWREWRLTVSENFLAVFFIVVVGEFFSAHVFRLMDDALHYSLDAMDDLERYGRHFGSHSLGSSFLPMVVCLIHDATIGLDIGHVALAAPNAPVPNGTAVVTTLDHPLADEEIPSIMLHFSFSGVMLAMASVLVLTSQFETHRGSGLWTRTFRGRRPGCFYHSRFLCSDVRMAVYAFAVFMMGIVFGVVDTFVMYRMVERGCATETPMGTMMMVRFLIDAIMVVRKDKLIHKYGNRHVVFVSFSFTLLAVQCILYALLKNPWMFVIPEVLHGFSRVFFWIGVHSLVENLSNAESERKIKQMLEGCHLRLGSAMGAFIGGLTYFLIGAEVMFYIAAAISLLLLLLIPLCDRVAPTSMKKQYSVVLLDDDEFQPLKVKSHLSGSDLDDDDSDDEEEDWYSRAEKEVEKEIDDRPIRKVAGTAKRKAFSKYGGSFKNNNDGERD